MIKFIFNNKNSFDDMDCIVVGTISYPFIKEDVEFIEVEGRKAGSLTEKTGNFTDLKLSMTLKLVNMKNYNGSSSRIQEWLESIKNNKLYFVDNPSKSYIVKTVNYTDITPVGGYEAKFKVTFVCEPFLKLTRETKIEIKKGDKVYNGGYIESEPIIRLSLPNTQQNIRIDINGRTFEIREVYGDVEINSSLMQIKGENNFRSIGHFPTLDKGNNIITWIGDINKFEIEKNTLWRA